MQSSSPAFSPLKKKKSFHFYKQKYKHGSECFTVLPTGKLLFLIMQSRAATLADFHVLLGSGCTGIKHKTNNNQ